MSNELLQKLEHRLDNVIDNIEIMRMQVEELEEAKAKLEAENATLKQKHEAWEQNLSSMLKKLDAIDTENQTQTEYNLAES